MASRLRRRERCPRWVLWMAAVGAVLRAPAVLRGAWDGPPNFPTASVPFLPVRAFPQTPSGDQVGRPSGSASSAAEAHKQSERKPHHRHGCGLTNKLHSVEPGRALEALLNMTSCLRRPFYFSPLVNASGAGSSQRHSASVGGGGFPGFGWTDRPRASQRGFFRAAFQAPLAAILHEDVRYIPTSQRSIRVCRAAVSVRSFSPITTRVIQPRYSQPRRLITRSLRPSATTAGSLESATRQGLHFTQCHRTDCAQFSTERGAGVLAGVQHHLFRRH